MEKTTNLENKISGGHIPGKKIIKKKKKPGKEDHKEDNSNISLKKTLPPYEQVINKWMSDNEICKHNDKKNSLCWDIIKCMYESDLGPDDFKEIIEKCKNNDITITEGNLWEKLKGHFEEKHITFLKCISNMCPRGLSTSPNADVGKFELFYRLVRPESRQPSKGDISDNGVKIEIKGSQIRLFSDKSGKCYIKETNQLFKNKGISGNVPKNGGLKGKEQFEIEKSQYQEYYSDQFCKDIPKSKTILKEYFKIHDINYSGNDIEDMFKNKGWNQSILQKLWLKKMFNVTMKKNGADKMIIFGDGTNVKILDSIDKLNQFKIDTDYFRINQDTPVGYYIE